MGKVVKVKIIMRYNTTTGWSAIGETAILEKGEIGIEYLIGSDLPKMKIGDGNRSWNNLPYFETTLPKNFTWGNLRGTTLQSETSFTKELELTKPGFKDIVNIITLNKNFDKIDNYYKLKNQEIQTLGERITLLGNSLASTPTDYSALQAEVEFARTINGTTYKSLSLALDALNQDLQTFKIELDNIIGQTMPSQLIIEENGLLYLADSNGAHIGEGVSIKDQDLIQKIEELKSKVIPNGLIYENNQLYLAVENERIGNPVEIKGGGSGIDISFKINLTAAERNISKPIGSQIILSYSYSSVDLDNLDDGFGNGELIKDGIQISTFLVKQGENTLDVTKFLSAGDNILKLKVTNSEGTSKILQFNITMLSLSIESNFPKMNKYNSDQIVITYTVKSESEKTVYFSLVKQDAKPNELYYEPTIINSIEWGVGNITSQFYLKHLPSGPYLLKIYATAGSGDSLLTSNVISLGMIWYTNQDISPIILMDLEKTVATQGEIISIPYLIFHPNNNNPKINLNVLSKGEIYSTETITAVSTPSIWTIQRYPQGEISFEIECENVKASKQIYIKESEISLIPFTEGLIFEFDPKGRTNANSANEWHYYDKEEKKEAIFSGVDWGNLDGWQIKKDSNGNFIEEQTMLRLLPGASMTIPFKPFEEEITTNDVGYSIEIELSAQSVTDYNALIIDSFDKTLGGERGLKIYASSIELKGKNNLITYQFKEEERIRLTFVIEPNISNKLITTYINGVSCGIKKYEEEEFRQENPMPLTIGAEKSGIDLYFIRFYKYALDMNQQLNNFAVDRPTYSEKINTKIKNDILNESANGALSKMITINSLKGTIPYIIMECPKLPQNKETDKFSGMKMTFVDPINTSRSFTAENCTFSVQGTSSAGYPVKNFKIKLDKNLGITYTQDNKQSVEGFYFQGKEKSQPTKVFCLKADYASSESANNVMLVDYFNQTCPYRNVAQQYQVQQPGGVETVRHGIYGEPIVLFWLNTDNNEISFQGKYNFNDDKDSEAVFGYIDVLPEDKYNIQCWEFKNNNTDLCLFSHNTLLGDENWTGMVQDENGKLIEAWANSFERRFPEQKDDTSYSEVKAFRRLVDWVASTNTSRKNDAIEIEDGPKIYKTLDKEAKANKIYYTDETCTESTKFDTTPYPQIKAQDSKITLYPKFTTFLLAQLEKIFEKEEDYFRGYIAIKEENSWKIIYYTQNENNEEIENLVVDNITNLNEIGISGAENQTYFVFDYYLFTPWQLGLYEKHIYDTADYRLAKFKNEFENYFILDAMAYYYVFTETMLLMDNRAKNMFLVSFDVDLEPVEEDGAIKYIKHSPGTYGHWAPTPYDMDSALGINNEGELSYSYHLEDTGEDGQVFTGQDSVLWNNFRECFSTEISDMYKKIRTQIGTTNGNMPFSYETLSTKMNNHQSKWPEIIWNIDQRIKYLEPLYNEKINYLPMAQGDKRAQRNSWLYNAFKYRDSKYSAGEALKNFILLRLYGKGTFNIKPYSNLYVRVQFGNAKDVKKRTLQNHIAQISTEGISAIYDLETQIYSADMLSSIGDLSDFKIGLCNFAAATKLQEILLGREEEGYKNIYLKELELSESNVLQKVDISNCVNLTSEINATKCLGLKSFRAKGSSITGVSFAKGARLTECKLPKTISSLNLLELQYLTSEGLSIEKNDNEKYNFFTIRIEKSNQIPFYDLIMNSPNLTYLRLTDLEWETDLSKLKTFYNRVKTLKGINENGETIASSSAIITGKIYLKENIELSLLKELNELYSNLTIIVNNKAQYFLTYMDFNNEPIYSYLAEENSLPLDPRNIEITKIDPEDNQEKTFTIEEWLNKKPQKDSNLDGIKDTKYIFKNWSNLPEKVNSSFIITPYYIESYLIRFFNEDKTEEIYDSQWVTQGNLPNDPVSEIPIKETTAKYSYIYDGWLPKLNQIIGPQDYLLNFKEILNTYTVSFFAGEKQVGESQTIAYGGSPLLPLEPIYKYYFNSTLNEYSYYEIYEHIGWDIYNDGNTDSEDVNTNAGLIIKPQEYTTEPIEIHAVFSSIEPITDSWKTIIENCNNGNYKTLYPIGTQKEISFNYKNKEYKGIVEVVAHNYDILASDSTSTAKLTFLLKDIFTTTIFRNEMNHTWNGITGPLAGGWTDNHIYSSIQDITFNNVIDGDEAEYLNNNIQTVLKKTDFGPGENNTATKKYYPTSNLEERIWTPSATEMGVLPPDNTEEEAYQGADGTKNSYIWFTNNDSRIKNYQNNPYKYWTRTWARKAWSFYGVGADGGYAYDNLSIPAIGILAFEQAGLIFGFCL